MTSKVQQLHYYGMDAFTAYTILLVIILLILFLIIRDNIPQKENETIQTQKNRKSSSRNRSKDSLSIRQTFTKFRAQVQSNGERRIVRSLDYRRLSRLGAEE